MERVKSWLPGASKPSSKDDSYLSNKSKSYGQHARQPSLQWRQPTGQQAHQALLQQQHQMSQAGELMTHPVGVQQHTNAAPPQGGTMPQHGPSVPGGQIGGQNVSGIGNPTVEPGASAALLSGAHGTLNIVGGNTNVTAVNTTGQTPTQDYHCSNICLVQTKTAKEYLDKPCLEWTLPKLPSDMKINYLKVVVKNSGKKEVFNKQLTAVEKCELSQKKLKCGEKFVATVYCFLCWNGQEHRMEGSADIEAMPSTPEKIGVKCKGGKLVVTWLPCTGAEKYQIDISDAKSGERLMERTIKGDEQKISIPLDSDVQVFLGQNYCFQVTAMRANDTLRNKSSPTYSFVGNAKCPKKVTVTLIKDFAEANVSWEKPDDNPTSYRVQALAGSKVAHELGTRKKEASFASLKSGTTYCFRVAAMFGDESSPWVTSDTVRTEACSLLVTSLRLEENVQNPATAIDCCWESVVGATCYRIKCNSGNSTVTADVNGKEERYTFKGLDPGREYKAKIKAQEERGFGPYSDALVIVTALGKASGLQAKFSNEDHPTINVKFVEAPMADNHRVELMGEDGKIVDQRVLQRGNTEVTFSRPACNKEYHATVVAIYNGKAGDTVNTPKVSTAPCKPDMSKVHCVADPGDPSSAFVVTWSKQERCNGYDVEIHCRDYNSETRVLKLEGETTTVHYKCSNVGCQYNVRLRSRNKSGYGDWCDAIVAKTAPRRINSVMCQLHVGDQRVVSGQWEAVTYATKYTVNLFHANSLARGPCETESNSYIFDHFTPINGLTYYCTVTPCNEAGNGETTRSNDLYMPLDPPDNVQVVLQESRAIVSWTPSEGMTAASICIHNSELYQMSTTSPNSMWVCHTIIPGELYELMVHAMNICGMKSQPVVKSFASAPSDVIVRRNENHPHSSLEVKVISKYCGPFLVILANAQTEEQQPFMIAQHAHAFGELDPATEYRIGAQCLLNNIASSTTWAQPVMTMPLKVTGVHCFAHEEGFDKTLKWDGCGNDAVDYNVTWLKNNLLCGNMKTKDTTYKFLDLCPGTHTFFVRAGDGPKSDHCVITVPATPDLKIEVMSKSAVRVTCSKVIESETYCYQIYAEFAEDPLETFETPNTDVWIDEKQFDFLSSVQYLLTVSARCGDHLSRPATGRFTTALQDPGNVTCKLDEVNPSHTVLCSWTPSRRMKQAKVQLIDKYGNVVASDEIIEHEYCFRNLSPNGEYRFRLWPGDGVRYRHEAVEKYFKTAPVQPEKVVCLNNANDPETSIDVEIVADHAGPFIITFVESDTNRKIESEVSYKNATIGDLVPGATYTIYAQCKFGDYVTGKTYFEGCE